jgi:predicted TIM-barrel fold metal-dependent hydrolase
MELTISACQAPDVCSFFCFARLAWFNSGLELLTKVMLTRRTIFIRLSAVGASFGLIASLRHTCSAGSSTTIKAAFDVPRGACDAHVHVIGDPADYPMSPERDYTPPPATVDELAETLKFLTIDRVVIVTPTIYGNDNSATIDAIRRLGKMRARGIALINESTPSEALDSMKEAGIAGIRLYLGGAGAFNRAAAAKRLQIWTNRAKDRGWHLQINTPPDVIAALAAQLAGSPVPLVLDTFGWIAGGVGQPGFDTLLSLLKSGRTYVKLAEPYRISKNQPDYSDVEPVVQAFVAANPDRVLWGSGWPHVASAAGRENTARNLPDDAGHLLNLFARWVPDAELRRKILVENPARLYGF